MTNLVKITEDDRRLCQPREHDERKEPGRCVIANHIREEHPWARHVSVGTRTIRMYDYRCEHNPEGLVGRCNECAGRRLIWATPLPAAKAIKKFDKGENPTFPTVRLNIADAEVQFTDANGNERKRNKTAQQRYKSSLQSGAKKPRANSPQAKARRRAKASRRNG